MRELGFFEYDTITDDEPFVIGRAGDGGSAGIEGHCDGANGHIEGWGG